MERFGKFTLYNTKIGKEIFNITGYDMEIIKEDRHVKVFPNGLGVEKGVIDICMNKNLTYWSEYKSGEYKSICLFNSLVNKEDK